MVAVNWASRYDSETPPSKWGLEINEGGSDVSDRSGLHGFPFDWTPTKTTHATTSDFFGTRDPNACTDCSPTPGGSCTALVEQYVGGVHPGAGGSLKMKAARVLLARGVVAPCAGNGLCATSAIAVVPTSQKPVNIPRTING